MLSNLPADRLNIGPKPAAGHYSRVEIAVSTFRLAEGNLHVNPAVAHRSKTLAHPGLNPGTHQLDPHQFEPPALPAGQRAAYSWFVHRRVRNHPARGLMRRQGFPLSNLRPCRGWAPPFETPASALGPGDEMRSREQHDSSEAGQAIMGLRRELMGACVWPFVVCGFYFLMRVRGRDGIAREVPTSRERRCCLWQSRGTARDPLCF